MDHSVPLIDIREPQYAERTACYRLVKDEWGAAAGLRFCNQWVECWKGGDYAPKFLVAGDAAGSVVGFVAYQRTMQLTFNIIWLVTDGGHRGRRIGETMLNTALAKIDDDPNGTVIEVITTKKTFYGRAGFFPVHHLGNEYYLMLHLTSTEFSL